MCLGGGIDEVENSNGTNYWTISSEKHAKSAIANAKIKLVETGLRLPCEYAALFSFRYHPSEDETPELDSEGLTFYQEKIGVLRWAVELRRVNILLEV